MQLCSVPPNESIDSDRFATEHCSDNPALQTRIGAKWLCRFRSVRRISTTGAASACKDFRFYSSHQTLAHSRTLANNAGCTITITITSDRRRLDFWSISWAPWTEGTLSRWLRLPVSRSMEAFSTPLSMVVLRLVTELAHRGTTMQEPVSPHAANQETLVAPAGSAGLHSQTSQSQEDTMSQAAMIQTTQPRTAYVIAEDMMGTRISSLCRLWTFGRVAPRRGMGRIDPIVVTHCWIRCITWDGERQSFLDR